MAWTKIIRIILIRSYWTATVLLADVIFLFNDRREKRSVPLTKELGFASFFFFLRFYLFFRERGREGGREGEKYGCVRETSIGCPSHTPNRGPGPQPRPVP